MLSMLYVYRIQSTGGAFDPPTQVTISVINFHILFWICLCSPPTAHLNGHIQTRKKKPTTNCNPFLWFRTILNWMRYKICSPKLGKTKCHAFWICWMERWSRLSAFAWIWTPKLHFACSSLQGWKLEWRVTVNADTVLRDALGLYKNSSFEIDRPLEVEFVGSEAVDLGGPRRQFFNVLIDGIKDNRTLLLFEREDYLLPCINHDAIIAGH